MPRFLIDANLPYRFALWQGEAYLHVFDLADDMPDAAIWRYARENDLVIVTKDADFSDRVVLSEPPPRVVHLRVGNLRIRELFAFLTRVWPRIAELSIEHKLIIVRESSIETIA